jgi:cell division control protein 6
MQLLEILHTRLGSIDEDRKFLPTPSLMLLSRKVASMTGDVRVLFGVLRGAIDLAVTSNAGTDGDSLPVVTPSHILAALKAYGPASAKTARFSNVASNSEVVAKVRNLGLQPQLVMLAILLASKRLEAGLSLCVSSPLKKGLSASAGALSVGGMGMDVGMLHAYYRSILSRAGNDIFQPVSRSEFGDLVGMLETVGLIALSSQNSLSTSVRSPSRGGRRSTSYRGNAAKGVQDVTIVEGVRGDEVQRGLGIGSVDGNARGEEINAIWEREGRKVGRDVQESICVKASGGGEDFEDAMED